MNQAFRLLVFFAFGYVIINVPLFRDIAKFFWYLIQLVGKSVWIVIQAAIENKPEDREYVIFFIVVFLILVGALRNRR